MRDLLRSYDPGAARRAARGRARGADRAHTPLARAFAPQRPERASERTRVAVFPSFPPSRPLSRAAAAPLARTR
jgi:hypothetical protein